MIKILTETPVFFQAFFYLLLGSTVVAIILGARAASRMRHLLADLKQIRKETVDFQEEAVKDYTRDYMRFEVKEMLKSMLLTAEMCGPIPFVDDTVAKTEQLLHRLNKTENPPSFDLVETYRELVSDYQMACIKQMEALAEKYTDKK